MNTSEHNRRALFLSKLAVNMPAFREELGGNWEPFRTELDELLRRLEASEGQDFEVADRIMVLVLKSPASGLAARLLRGAGGAEERGLGWGGPVYEEDFNKLSYESLTRLWRDDGGFFSEPDLLREAGRMAWSSLWGGELAEVSEPVARPEVEPANREPFETRSDQPAAGPAAPQRYLSANTRDKVAREEVFALTVRVTTAPGGAGPGEASTLVPDLAGRITINVHGTGVAFVDGSMRLLEVPAEGNSSPVMFTLKATTSGVHKIEVTAWNGAAHVAGVTVWVAVDANPNTLPDEDSGMDMREPEPGEYTLEIVFEKEYNRYRFQLRGESVGVLKPEYSETLTGALQSQYENMLDSLNRQARNLNRLTPYMQENWLKGLGKMMAQYLVPKSMCSVLWDLRDNIRRLNILCDGDLLPWELLFIPSPDGADGVFLAEGAGLARWRYGPPPPTKIRLLPPYLVHPNGSPAQTATEIERLRSFFPNAQVVRDMDGLFRLLTTGGFGMLHFASHNNLQPDDAGGSFVPFGNARFDLVFMANVAEKKYASTTPLVFMNACTSAGKAPLFTDVSSWADRYLYSGAGAFVGSLWEVRDQSAPEFAAAFYQKLTSGGTLGEAVKAGREIIKANNPGDPTRLAYTLYGNPLAKLQL